MFGTIPADPDVLYTAKDRPRVSGIFHPRILKVPGPRPSLPYRTLLTIKFLIITSVMVVTFMSKNQPGDRLLNQHNIHI